MNQRLMFSDSHCHLDFQPLYEDLSGLLSTCEQLGIHRIIVPAVEPNNWQQVLHVVNKAQHSQVSILPCLGIHPWYLQPLHEHSLSTLSQLISENREQIYAIGETGLDGNIAEQHQNWPKQVQFFKTHLELAKQYNLPVIIHHYKAHHQVTNILREKKLSTGGIIHGFSGSYQQAKQYIDLGFKLGIGGTITYPRAQKTIKTLKKLPLDSIVLETDAPAMPLYGHQGKPNHPKHIMNVFNAVCQYREESPEQIATALEENINAVFKLTFATNTNTIALTTKPT